MHKAFEEATGKSIELRPVPKEGLDDFYAAVFPPLVAAYFSAMNKSYLPGGVLDVNLEPTAETRHGKTDLKEVVKQLVGA